MVSNEIDQLIKTYLNGSRNEVFDKISKLNPLIAGHVCARFVDQLSPYEPGGDTYQVSCFMRGLESRARQEQEKEEQEEKECLKRSKEFIARHFPNGAM